MLIIYIYILSILFVICFSIYLPPVYCVFLSPSHSSTLFQWFSMCLRTQSQDTLIRALLCANHRGSTTNERARERVRERGRVRERERWFSTSK